MKLYWSNESLSEIEKIVQYIAKDNVTATVSLADTIFELTERVLTENAKIGRPGRVEGTRELVVHSSYIVVYRLRRENIEILTIRHTARLWLKTF